MFDARTVKERLRGHAVYSQSVALLVGQYIDYGYSHYPITTARPRASHLRQLVAFLRAAEISYVENLTLPVIDTFILMYGETHSEGTVMAMKRTLRIFAQWLIDYKEIHPPFSPTVIKIKKLKNKPKALDIDLVCMAIRKADEEDSLMIHLMIETGIRIGEVTRIDVHDIADGRIDIKGKGGIRRYACMTEELTARVHDFCDKYERFGSAPLFQKNNGWSGRLSPDNARNRVQRVFTKHCSLKMTPHQLRHTFAIEMLKAGCDPITIQKLLGHKHFATTQIYLEQTDDHIRDEYLEHVNIMKKGINILTNQLQFATMIT